MKLVNTNPHTTAIYDEELMDEKVSFDGDDPEVDDEVGQAIVENYPSVYPAGEVPDQEDANPPPNEPDEPTPVESDDETPTDSSDN